MTILEPFPAVAEREFCCLDRFAPPDALITAEGPVPDHSRLWVVRDGRGHRFVCRKGHLADLPPERWYQVLRDSAA